MAVSRASAVWEGDLTSGSGHVSTQSGVLVDAPVSWNARTERPSPQTSPEELLAAAHATCYAMAFSNTLAQAGNAPERLAVSAECHFTPADAGGYEVSRMDLDVRGRVPGLDQPGFEQAAREGEQGCPISNAIRGNVDIRLTATLET